MLELKPITIESVARHERAPSNLVFIALVETNSSCLSPPVSGEPAPEKL